MRHAERLMRIAYDYLGGTPETKLIKALSELDPAIPAAEMH